jgi:hypothetical protein
LNQARDSERNAQAAREPQQKAVTF